jgi:hypothetical protein
VQPVRTSSARASSVAHWNALATTGLGIQIPRTRIGDEGDATAFYAGEAAIELHRTETTNYRQTLSSGMPALCVLLRPRPAISGRPAFDILTVTADPSEGEAQPGHTTAWSMGGSGIAIRRCRKGEF